MTTKTETQVIEDLEYRMIVMANKIRDLEEVWDADKGLAYIKTLEKRIIKLEHMFDRAVRAAESLSSGDTWYWEFG
ncbi:hypothetical protein N9E35_01610 [Candidatus Marinimicrobia bacterium]|jgi:hypothetical protein|nr:hypothetical protein [Candidatus Neomarinimicrobiota bacterium]